MKWVIVEDALRDRKGHWLEYVSTFVRELRALGDEVVVLCDRQAQGFVMEQTGSRPVLPESIWHRMGDRAGALRRYARVPGHAIATFFAMRKVFRGFNHGGHREHRGESAKKQEINHENHEKARINKAGQRLDKPSCAAFSSPSTSELARDSENTSLTRSAIGPASALDAGRWTLDLGEALDWIFVPTVLVHHLLGWWVLLKAGSVPKESRVLLFFPNLPIRLDDIGLAHWSGGPTTKLMAWLFTNLKKEVEGGRVVLGVETHAMRRALEALIQMRVVYLPHPVEAQGETRVERRESRASSPATSYSPPGTSAKPIIFGCYGAARWEKGSDIFQEAIKLILKNEVAGEKWQLTNGENQFLPDTSYPLLVTAAGRPLRFAIQWVEDFRDDSGNLVSIDPWLREHPQVEVIGRYFEGDEYERQLAATDVMVLPYRSPYRLRVSRVVIEAMIHGMPVVATRGTTLFEQAEEHGVVWGCEEGSAESLAEAMQEVVKSFKMLGVSAEEKVHVAAENFSVACFRKIVMKSSYERK
jgi:glycosyltransferase involved in cell wall biosynthesis